MNTNENQNKDEMVMLTIKTQGNNFPLAMPRRVAEATILKLHEQILNPGENPRARCLEWADGTRIYTIAVQGWMVTPYKDPEKTAKERAEFERRTAQVLERMAENMDKAVGEMSEGEDWKQD